MLIFTFVNEHELGEKIVKKESAVFLEKQKSRCTVFDIFPNSLLELFGENEILCFQNHQGLPNLVRKAFLVQIDFCLKVYAAVVGVL